MKITPIRAFSDNYIWLYEDNGQAIVVDPGEADQVLAFIVENKLHLEAILLTHKHDDHIGGVATIQAKYPEVTIIGPSEVADLASSIVKDGDTFEVLGETVRVMKTAGHTEEHVSFLLGESLFCGDALFSAGCGRVFTGDYQAQYDALQKFNALSNETKVYAGHEYTQTNLEFAQTVMPASVEVSAELERVKNLDTSVTPSLPTTIGKEREINPFLRAKSLEDFRKLRDGRDQF